MTHIDARLRDELIEVRPDRINRFDTVMHKEDLPAALKLTQDGLTNKFRRIGPNVRDNRQALFGRGVEVRYIAHARQRHVKRAWNGSRRQREHIHFGAEFLEVFLMSDAESLLFINYDKSEILELHIARK